MFLKAFKKTAENYEFEHRISLTVQVFGNLVNTAEICLNRQFKNIQQNTVEKNRQPIKGLNFNTRARMVEAMYKRSPSYFEQFQKQHSVKIVDQKPTDITSLIIYAVCPHFESEICQIATNTNHFYLLIDSSTDIGSTKQNKSFAVLCLFTTFKHLFSNSSKLATNGDVFTTLKLAVDFNDKTGEKINPPSVYKRLPISFSTTTKMLTTTKTTASNTAGIAQKTIDNIISTGTGQQQTQTDQICAETLKRVENSLSGPHSAAFCRFMNILVSSYGKLGSDSELVFVRLVIQEKIKFWNKYFIQQKLKHHMKSKAKQLNIIKIYNLSFTKYNMRTINTKKSTVWVLTLNWFMFEKLTCLCISIRIGDISLYRQW